MLFSSVSMAGLSEEQRQTYGQMLSILVSQHYRYTKPLFEALERAGVFLGNGYFAVAVIQEDSPVLYARKEDTLLKALAWVIQRHLRTPLYYAVWVGGCLHLILCYPRAERTEEARSEVSKQLFSDFSAVMQELDPAYPQLRVLISDVFFGETELFLAANSLHHAMEYYAFLSERPRVAQLNTERQLHGAFVDDLYVYRKLSNQAIEQLTGMECDLSVLSNAIVDTIIRNSSASMESVHHHIQMFLLTFTEQLSDSGLVDSEYMRQHQIVRKGMAFETEAELRGAVEGIVQELHRQYLMLTAIGKQQKIQAVRDYVLSHISNCDLSVNQLAEQFSISPSQLTKQFRRYFAVSLHQFIQSTRLQRAKELIAAHPQWSLREIGTAAGYTDISTMYRAFQKVDGISPGALKYQAMQRTDKT